MSLIDDLAKKENWELLYNDKVKKNHMPPKELEDLAVFIANEEYLPVVQKIQKQEPFPEPTLKKINKKNTEKKRTVFVFGREENYDWWYLNEFLMKPEGADWVHGWSHNDKRCNEKKFKEIHDQVAKFGKRL